MNQSKFSLADVLTVLAAVSFGFFCFLSMNFFTLGNTVQSIIYAVVFAVLLGGIAFIVKLLKKTSRNFQTCIIWEVILLFLFAVIAFAGISTFSHYFTVSDQKNEIQSQVTASITQAENIFAGYELYAQNREKLYKSKLKSVVYAKNINPSTYAGLGFEDNGIADEKQIENKMFTIHANLFPSNFTGMKQNNSTWLAEARNTIEHWKPIGVVGVINDIEKNTKDWLNELTKLSTVREKGENAEDFSYNLSFDDVKTKFKTLGNPITLSFTLAIGLYLLMLLSYFITKRHSKFPGFKLLFATGKAADNEL